MSPVPRCGDGTRCFAHRGRIPRRTPNADAGLVWARWWRLREYAADDYAARLGQAEELATFLEENVLLYDIPIGSIWMTTESHPPTALRIERLRQRLERV